MSERYGIWPRPPWSGTGRVRSIASDNPDTPVLELNPKAWFRADQVVTDGESVLSMTGLVGSEGDLTVGDGFANLGTSTANNDTPYVSLEGFLTSTMPAAFWDFMMTGQWSLFAVYKVTDDAVNIASTDADDWALYTDVANEIMGIRVGDTAQYFDGVAGGTDYPTFLGDLVYFQGISTYPGLPIDSNLVFDCGPFPVGSPTVGNGGPYNIDLPLASVGTLRCGSNAGPILSLAELIFFDRSVDADAEVTVITGYLLNRYRAP